MFKELDTKLAKLSDADRALVVTEFTKLVDKLFFLPITQLPQKCQEDIIGNAVLFYPSIASSFKDSLSTQACCHVNASKVTRMGQALNDLLLTGSGYICVGRHRRETSGTT